MSRQRAIVTTLLVLMSVRATHACSCSNNMPIQQSSERYRDRAVFTAHVVQLMGRINWDGKRLSSQVLAVVKERYWGLPWYWPKIVVLDGGFFCNIAMEEGQDYLVSGRRERYGVLDVAGCSRTQPLRTAQIDLRTLDGTHCSGPGGTIIGHVYRGQDEFRPHPVAPGTSLTFRDQDGNTYSAHSDKDGIYELRHLPVGTYSLDSRLSPAEYAFMRGDITVSEGLCGEASVLLRNYVASGRLLPGPMAVKLVGAVSGETWLRVNLQSDGRFYFGDVPDGEYLLAVESSLQGQDHDFYYPGTHDRSKATRIRISNHTVAGPNEFDFKPDSLPFVPIRVALDPATDSGKFYWRILLTTPDNILEEERWTRETKFVVLHGLRGRSYGVRLWGDADYKKTSQGFCSSKDLPITAQPGMPLLHIPVPAECR